MDHPSESLKVSTEGAIFDIRKSHFLKLVVMEYLKTCETREKRLIEDEKNEECEN